MFPPFFKGGQGGLYNHLIIPLNPPLEKQIQSNNPKEAFEGAISKIAKKKQASKS
jgi:hypothetical protein